MNTVATLRLMTIFAVMFVLSGCNKGPVVPPTVPEPKSPPETEILDVAQVRTLIPSKMCGFEYSAWISQMCNLGTRAFPAYETILTDPQSDPVQVIQVCLVLSEMKTDRKRFIPAIVRRLSDPVGGVRQNAVVLLGEIGEGKETQPILLLLPDDDGGVRYGAAKTLAKIGGKRDLDAMDSWLKDGKHPNDPDYLKHVKNCRDELEKRLKTNPPSKDRVE